MRARRRVQRNSHSTPAAIPHREKFISFGAKVFSECVPRCLYCRNPYQGELTCQTCGAPHDIDAVDAFLSAHPGHWTVTATPSGRWRNDLGLLVMG